MNSYKSKAFHLLCYQSRFFYIFYIHEIKGKFESHETEDEEKTIIFYIDYLQNKIDSMH